MQDIQELLINLEEDGKCYAHFFAHPAHPGYYGIWVRERTPEYTRHWLPGGPLAGYTLVFSLEMPDTSFTDYMLETHTDHVEANFIKVLCRIDDICNSEQWLNGFKAWKQEKIRLERVQWLEQYRQVAYGFKKATH